MCVLRNLFDIQWDDDVAAPLFCRAARRNPSGASGGAGPRLGPTRLAVDKPSA